MVMIRELLVVGLCLLAGCQTPAPILLGEAVVATMNSGGYTYIKLLNAEAPTWYAVPECEVAVGDRVEVAPGAMAMQNFESRTLKRTFALIYFADGLTVFSPAKS
jgi:hypothetical protein